VAVRVEQDVLGLQVAADDINYVQVVQCGHNLGDVEPHFVERKLHICILAPSKELPTGNIPVAVSNVKWKRTMKGLFARSSVALSWNIASIELPRRSFALLMTFIATYTNKESEAENGE
jgi:hypothetical protein